ncbi:hypothetical protein [Ruminiclostridium cellobioparum]|uniref:Uncharacterized protein n=1 Tax=Ruminiclostridium cellobioparum subsp. termitidis CT1112 TaxID=1195236 RepID=S0FJK4_RUMCE|nr:hypothetical protein [Ruminiclostridium cellobioparum]EMS70461.1 hypothetical protein CTER_3816 [Ruminiclostridium cellobioparum subsp. termitidis CT1112]
MRKVKRTRLIVIILAMVLVVNAGLVGYSMIGGNLPVSDKNSSDNSVKTTVNTQNSKTVDNGLKDEASTEISKEILDLIKTQDPDSYTKNLNNYKQLLELLNVHVKFKNEIERLIKKGKKLPDILIAYSFLNDCYGGMEDIEKLVDNKEAGKKWPDIFKEYFKNNPEFVPRDFESDYLERLLDSGTNQDTIMIADRVSQKAKVEIDTLISKKQAGESWRLINAEYGIVNGLEKSPHLSVTRTQLTKYTTQTNLSEKEVINALTIGTKLGESADSVLNSVKKGLSKEEIYAMAFEEKYY